MFKEEKKVANKAPVDGISIENIGERKPEIEEKNLIKNSGNLNIIKFADLYFEDLAQLLKRLIKEYNIKNIMIDKINDNVYRVYKGLFHSLNSIKMNLI